MGLRRAETVRRRVKRNLLQVPLSLGRVDVGWVLLRSGQMDVATWIGDLDNLRVAIATATVVAPGHPASPAYTYRHIVGFDDTT